jgi:predicted phage tail protein
LVCPGHPTIDLIRALSAEGAFHLVQFVVGAALAVGEFFEVAAELADFGSK